MASPPVRNAHLGIRKRWKRKFKVWRNTSAQTDLNRNTIETSERDTTRLMETPTKEIQGIEASPTNRMFHSQDTAPRRDVATPSRSLCHSPTNSKAIMHRGMSRSISDQDLLHIQTPELHPYFQLPAELQVIFLEYLPYNTLLALRLTSKHFAHKVVPYHFLIQARQAFVAASLKDEEQALKGLLTIPGSRSRWYKFQHQNVYFNDELFIKLEDYLRGYSDESPLSPSQIQALKATEYLRCYTCLELKSSMRKGDFFGTMSCQSYGLGGSKASSRMCKDCMLRKKVADFYGTWWIDAEARRRDVVFIRDDPLARLMSYRYTRIDQQVFDGEMQTKERCQPKERAVCAACRNRLDLLWWGCPTCFELRNENRTRTVESRLDSWKARAKYKITLFCVRNHDRLRRYTGMSCTFPSWYMIRHPQYFELSRLRTLFGGCSLWQYRDYRQWHHSYQKHLKTQKVPDPITALAVAEAANVVNLFDERIRALQQEWKPYTVSHFSIDTQHWELRCDDCWSTNTRLSSFGAVTADREEQSQVHDYRHKLDDEDLCERCKSAMITGDKERIKRRTEKKRWLSRRDNSVQDNHSETDEEVFDGVHELFGDL